MPTEVGAVFRKDLTAGPLHKTVRKCLVFCFWWFRTAVYCCSLLHWHRPLRGTAESSRENRFWWGGGGLSWYHSSRKMCLCAEFLRRSRRGRTAIALRRTRSTRGGQARRGGQRRDFFFELGVGCIFFFFVPTWTSEVHRCCKCIRLSQTKMQELDKYMFRRTSIGSANTSKHAVLVRSVSVLL